MDQCSNHVESRQPTAVKRPAEGPLLDEAEPSKKVKMNGNSSKNPSTDVARHAARSLSHLLQWKEEMTVPQPPFAVDSCKYPHLLFRHVQVERLTDCCLEELGQNLQAVLINARWKPSEPKGLSLE